MKKTVHLLLSTSILFFVVFVVCLLIEPLRSLSFGLLALWIGSFLLFGTFSSAYDEINRLEWLLEESEMKMQALEERLRQLENRNEK